MKTLTEKINKAIETLEVYSIVKKNIYYFEDSAYLNDYDIESSIDIECTNDELMIYDAEMARLFEYGQEVAEQILVGYEFVEIEPYNDGYRAIWHKKNEE